MRKKDMSENEEEEILCRIRIIDKTTIRKNASFLFIRIDNRLKYNPIFSYNCHEKEICGPSITWKYNSIC